MISHFHSSSSSRTREVPHSHPLHPPHHSHQHHLVFQGYPPWKGEGWDHVTTGAQEVLVPAMVVLREWALVDWNMRSLRLTDTVIDPVMWIESLQGGRRAKSTLDFEESLFSSPTIFLFYALDARVPVHQAGELF